MVPSHMNSLFMNIATCHGIFDFASTPSTILCWKAKSWYIHLVWVILAEDSLVILLKVTLELVVEVLVIVAKIVMLIVIVVFVALMPDEDTDVFKYPFSRLKEWIIAIRVIIHR